jgi:DNA-binding LacI/PurR family transcriptional regulator
MPASPRPAGERALRVSITDVAREAGVSISTVSVALNGRDGVSERTRERIVGIAERLGWVPSIRAAAWCRARAVVVYLRDWRATGSAHARRQAYQQLRGLGLLSDPDR